ncbi:MAG: PQQ-dependent dehydrogenase, methanol/ethanol family [Acidobacteriia bacterium]|nr:PQQ-dependent dehydrogenase, methanol/ethanol family [Terriglobia bacterium]
MFRTLLLLASLAANVFPLPGQTTGATTGQWPSYGGTHSALRFSALDQINASNVDRLTPVWVFQTGDHENGLQATPIVVDGVLYLSTSSNWVLALDAASGKLLWEYRFTLPTGAPVYGKQNRGVAVGHGLVFMGTADNHVVALEQKTGKEVWRVNVQDSKQCGCNITGAPLLVKDKLVVGGTGGDSAHRGYITAFDARTGRLAWRFHVIPGPGEKGNETWPGESWRFGGGAPWLTGSYDPQLNLIYWGTGNASSDLYAGSRKGDNLYTASILALDADTGKLRWYYQEVPGDVWDYDSAYETILADLPIKGRTRKVLLHPTKTGYTWVLDRATGEFLAAWKFAKHVNWISGITESGKLVGRREPELGKATFICPGAAGAKSWNHSAFSPLSGLLFIPVFELCNDMFARVEEAQEGKVYMGGNMKMKMPPGEKVEAYLGAYDAVTGERKWAAKAQTWLLASILATAGNLVFTGDPEGNFFALDAGTGNKLWSFSTGGGHRGSSITYAVKGRQYVATPTGWGSIVGNFHAAVWPDAPAPRAGSALFVFALPEARR